MTTESQLPGPLPPSYNVALDCPKEDTRMYLLARVAAREIIALQKECDALRIQLDIARHQSEDSRNDYAALKLKISEFNNSVNPRYTCI